MIKLLLFIFSISLVYGNDINVRFLFNPFQKKKKINYSLNDISNYPIGIFKIDRKYIDYSVSFKVI